MTLSLVLSFAQLLAELIALVVLLLRKEERRRLARPVGRRAPPGRIAARAATDVGTELKAQGSRPSPPRVSVTGEGLSRPKVTGYASLTGHEGNPSEPD